jgi:hypothetical protein
MRGRLLAARQTHSRFSKHPLTEQSCSTQIACHGYQAPLPFLVTAARNTSLSSTYAPSASANCDLQRSNGFDGRGHLSEEAIPLSR